MRSFRDYLDEQDIGVPSDPRRHILFAINYIAAMEPDEYEDAKDLVLQLQKTVDKKVAGMV